MTDTIYYYCRFCAERLAARLVMDFDSYPTVREDVQKKISIFQHSFIDLDLKILPQSICKSCYETLNRAFLFANKMRKSQIVLIELYLDIVGSDDDDNEESLSKIRRSVEGPLCVNGEDTSVHEEQNTSDSVDKEAFSTDENKSVGAEAIKESSDNEATSLGRHKTGKEPNVCRQLVNLGSTAAENDTSLSQNDTSLSQNNESITVIECKEESSDTEEDTDRILNTDSIEDRTVVNCCELSKNQESLDCKEETSNNDYEDTELEDPLDTTTEDDPIMRETLSLQGQDTFESQVEVTSSGHDTVCKDPNEDSELLNLNTTSTGTDTMTPQNHELITIVEFKEETTENEEDSDKINNKYSTEDRGATATETETPSSESQESKSSKEVTKASDNDTDRIVGTNSTVGRASVVKETVATQSQESLECKEQKKRKRKKENNDKNYDEKQQKKKRKRENNDNDYEDRKRKDQIDITTDRHPILKETVPLHSQESSECQGALTPDKDHRVDKVSVSIVTWDTNLYDCKLCDSKFSDINSLREHCKSLHQVCNGFRCRECSMELADFDTFVSHHREHRPELEDVCQFCNMELKSAGAGHVASHGDLFCKFCGEVFTSASGFKEHYLLYAPEAVNNGRSHCVHCGHELGNDETPHRDSFSDACVACGEHFREQTLQQQHSTRENNTFLSTDAPISTDKENVYFECDHCHKQFKVKSALTKHMTIHYDVYPFHCKFCDAKFKLSCNWFRHLKTAKHTRTAAGDTSSVTLERYFECDHCHKQFNAKSTLQQHMTSHYNVYPFYCQICYAKFKLRSYLKQHLKSDKHARADTGKTGRARADTGKTGRAKIQNYFECDHCHKQFKFKWQLQLHMASHLDVYPFYCKPCDTKFKLRSYLKHHLKSGKHARAAAASGIIQSYFECDHCQKQFECKSNLQQHMDIHYAVYPFYCKLCDAKFKSHADLKNHLKTGKHARAVAGERETRWKYFECDHCHKQYKFKCHLQRHMTSHYKVYLFYCKVCDAKFKHNFHLIRHLKYVQHASTAAGDTSSSRSDKYFECDHCHKQFKEKCNLRKHMVIHYDVYPFYCKICDAKYKRRGDFNDHLKSIKHVRAAAGETSKVTLEKYFECDYCHKQLSRKSNLQEHMTIHYEVYAFYCKFCDAKFKSSSSWKKHLKSAKHTRTAAGDTSSVTLE